MTAKHVTMPDGTPLDISAAGAVLLSQLMQTDSAALQKAESEMPLDGMFGLYGLAAEIALLPNNERERLLNAARSMLTASYGFSESELP